MRACVHACVCVCVCVRGREVSRPLADKSVALRGAFT